MIRCTPVAAAALAVVWVGALSAGPILPVAIAGVLYAAGSLVCHQMPDRSFHLDLFQLPVCARCFGLYAGAAAGSLAAAVVQGLAVGARWSAGARQRRYILTCAAAVPTALTLILERGFGWPLSNEIRALAAVPFAAVVAFVVVITLATLHYDECRARRPIGHGQSHPPANI